ncbi:MAG: hypothetical protein KGY99_07125 [Phycisphaerae bacterium]|nr:hypothetical protein [Phycisphaerae bacterium]
MVRMPTNTQMFALRRRPPTRVQLAGGTYRLQRVFKHDFFAATCLYQRVDADSHTAPPRRGERVFDRVVVKFARTRTFCGVPLGWLGRWMRAHEEGVYRALDGVAGVPRWAGRLGEAGYAIEYVDAPPLDHLDTPPAGFFDRLRDVLDAVHARGVGYCDANKRSNILCDAAGRAWLVDFQLSIRRRDDWPRPVRAILARLVAYVAERDLYHLYKHKRRLAPQELTDVEAAWSRRRRGLHRLHRKLTKPWRAVRRRWLNRQHRAGRLRSPTADLEDHRQPEKSTWRDEA